MSDKKLLLSIKFLVGVMFCVSLIGLHCSRADNPIRPHDHPIVVPDTTIVHDTTTVIVYDTTYIPIIFKIVDLSVEGKAIIDISPNNIYSFKKNGIEEGRIKLSEVSQIPRTVIISHTFKDYKMLEDTFSIEVISGSRAEVKEIRVVEIIYKE